MNSAYMEFEFGKLHYTHNGVDKKTTILFLHSFNSSAASFGLVCELLKDDFNVIALDLPGHGSSSHVDINKHPWYYSFEGFTALLTQFVDRLRLKQFFIVGDSVGGNMAIRAAASLKNLHGIVFMGSVHADSKQKLFELHYPSEVLGFLFNKDLNEDEINAIAAANVSHLNKEAFGQMKYDISRTDGNCRKVFSQYMDTQPWVDEPGLLKNSGLSFVYVLGKQDGFINYRVYKDFLMEKGVTESQIKVFNHVGHVPPLEDAQLCAGLISEFIMSSLSK
jgi:pimeloyl-ACP methyl ester carboxylesterase